jgi:ribonuclease P protein component
LEFTFNKSERISKKKDIDHLFANGMSFIFYPLRVVYSCIESSNKGSISILISVPKRKFKRAVKRNRIKRLIREAYRLNKGRLKGLIEDRNFRVLIGFIYLDNEVKEYHDIEKGIKKTMELLEEKLVWEKF